MRWPGSRHDHQREYAVAAMIALPPTLVRTLSADLGLAEGAAGALLQNLPNAVGIARSLTIYRAPGRAARLDAFHRRFLDPGDGAFDIGAHVGDRTASFLRCGARVVAVEPQPALAALLRRLFADRVA